MGSAADARHYTLQLAEKTAVSAHQHTNVSTKYLCFVFTAHDTIFRAETPIESVARFSHIDHSDAETESLFSGDESPMVSPPRPSSQRPKPVPAHDLPTPLSARQRSAARDGVRPPGLSLRDRPKNLLAVRAVDIHMSWCSCSCRNLR